MSTETLSSIPARPLALPEAESLMDDREFMPLSVVSGFPDWLEGHEWSVEHLKEADTAVVVTMLYMSDDSVTAIGFSAPDDGWIKIDRWKSEDYDHKTVEETVQEWGREIYPEWKHGNIDVDL